MPFKICLLVFSIVVSSHYAYGRTIESGPSEVQLIELYTSEGCSSCPPADRWLNAFENNPNLWKSFVPVAFHVDYWDYIGWKDSFAKEQFSERQRRYRIQGNIKNVYTPGFVVQGEEWRGWFRRFPRPSVSPKKVGQIKIELGPNSANVQFRPTKPMKSGVVNFAVLGFDIEHAITRGENSGVRLHHEFVVLDHQQQQAHGIDGNLQAKFTIENVEYLHFKKLAVAAWVSEIDNQRPLQAAGGWLKAGS